MNVLSTVRLDLRELSLEDAEFILELLNETKFIEFIGDKGVRTLADARAYISQGPVDSYLHNGYGLYAVTLKDGTPIGICGLVNRVGLDDPDIGFAFLARHASRGYAIESAQAIYEHGLSALKMRRIVAIVTPGNAKCIAVLTKLGMQFERFVRLSPGAEELKLYA